MPPKPKRLPNPFLHHLKHSRQLLEDFLYQYLPQLAGMGAMNRLNLFTWFSGKWGLSPDAKSGLPYMVLEALRLQRQYLLNHKLPLKPLNLQIFGPPQEQQLAKALPLLQEINRQSHTAQIASTTAPWQEVLRQLQAQLQRQPATERNLLLLDPMELPLPPLRELLSLLPKRMDVLLVLPIAAVLEAGGLSGKKPPHEGAIALAKWLRPLLKQATAEQPEGEIELSQLLQQLKESIMEASKHFVMVQQQEDAPVLLFGLTHDALMMEKMLQARQKLEKLSLQNTQAGDQLGLFYSVQTQAVSGNMTELLIQLLNRQPEWSNQELYLALLQHELLPSEASQELQKLIEAGSLELLDEKKKKLKLNGALPLTHTAYKLPAPSRYFRLKD